MVIPVVGSVLGFTSAATALCIGLKQKGREGYCPNFQRKDAGQACVARAVAKRGVVDGLKYMHADLGYFPACPT